jgi:hypothetical protein
MPSEIRLGDGSAIKVAVKGADGLFDTLHVELSGEICW